MTLWLALAPTQDRNDAQAPARQERCHFGLHLRTEHAKPFRPLHTHEPQQVSRDDFFGLTFSTSPSPSLTLSLPDWWQEPGVCVLGV